VRHLPEDEAGVAQDRGALAMRIKGADPAARARSTSGIAEFELGFLRYAVPCPSASRTRGCAPFAAPSSGSISSAPSPTATPCAQPFAWPPCVSNGTCNFRKKTLRGLNSLGVLQLYRYPCLSWLPAMSFYR
jgi:hypothetical protein